MNFEIETETSAFVHFDQATNFQLLQFLIDVTRAIGFSENDIRVK